MDGVFWYTDPTHEGIAIIAVFDGRARRVVVRNSDDNESRVAQAIEALSSSIAATRQAVAKRAEYAQLH